MMRKTNKNKVCVSSENTLYTTFRGLNWVAMNQNKAITNINQNFQLNNCAITNNPRAQPLMQTAVKCSIIFNELKIWNSVFVPIFVWFSLFTGFRASLFQLSAKFDFSRLYRVSVFQFSAKFGFSRNFSASNCR